MERGRKREREREGEERERDLQGLTAESNDPRQRGPDGLQGEAANMGELASASFPGLGSDQPKRRVG